MTNRIRRAVDSREKVTGRTIRKHRSCAFGCSRHMLEAIHSSDLAFSYEAGTSDNYVSVPEIFHLSSQTSVAQPFLSRWDGIEGLGRLSHL